MALFFLDNIVDYWLCFSIFVAKLLAFSRGEVIDLDKTFRKLGVGELEKPENHMLIRHQDR